MVGRACTALHIPLALDVTQSAGMMGIDVGVVQPAFLCCSVHKWLLGPYGFCLVYVAKRYHATGRPLEHFERNRAGSSDPSWDIQARVLTERALCIEVRISVEKIRMAAQKNQEEMVDLGLICTGKAHRHAFQVPVTLCSAEAHLASL